jgi:hypothetical protein
MPLSNQAEEALISCALRFDGYAYAQRRGDDQILATLSNRFIDSFRTFDDPLENLAAFFALQRFLYKWGGEYLTESSREHVAFRLLFLHLYRAEIGPEFTHEEYDRRWRQLTMDKVEQLAAEIRQCIYQAHPDDPQSEFTINKIARD